MDNDSQPEHSTGQDDAPPPTVQSHPHHCHLSPARARLCALISQLSEPQVEAFLPVVELFVRGPRPATVDPLARRIVSAYLRAVSATLAELEEWHDRCGASTAPWHGTAEDVGARVRRGEAMAAASPTPATTSPL